ncbi:MAG: glycosyltransferase family 2 protein [Alphaproteobacteria bacterium]
MELPFISVILPTFNRASTLMRAVGSVLDQDYRAFELIIVDDGSTDQTDELVSGLDDSRVSVIRQPVNYGQSRARNIGILKAKGAVVAFQDSDDEWLPGKLKLQALAMAEAGPDVGVVSCDMIRNWRDGRSELMPAPEVRLGTIFDDRQSLYLPYGLGIQACLIRRDLLLAVGSFDEHLRCLEDLELFLRLAQRCKFVRVPHALVRYYDTDGVSRNGRYERAAREYLIRQYGPLLMSIDAERVAHEISAMDLVAPAADLADCNTTASERCAHLEVKLMAADAARLAAERRHAQQTLYLSSILQSTSWRITRPLRAIGARIPRLARQAISKTLRRV